MKTNLFKYALSVGLVLFLLACSTKKNSFVRRNYHAVTAEYNILYNGGVAFDKGVEELKGIKNEKEQPKQENNELMNFVLIKSQHSIVSNPA
mgnify:CR=1 FL=1